MFFARQHNRSLFCFISLTLLLAGLTLLLVAQSAKADELQQLQNDLSPIEGVVVMAIGEEYIVDLDAKAGLRQGDLLRVATEGKAIVHPLTQEVIGHLSETQAVLQVRQMQSGYAYARTLSQTAALKPGTPVVRYAGLNAWLVADQKAQTLYTRLRTTLSQFNWQAPMTPEAFAQKAPHSAADLLFVVDGSQLRLKNGTETLIASYPLPADMLAGNTSATHTLAAAPQGDQPAQKSLIETRRSNLDQGIWQSKKFAGEATALSLADIDGDQQPEVLLLAPQKIYIGKIVDRQWQAIKAFDFPANEKALRLDTLDLDNDGKAEILVTLWQSDEPVLQIYSLDQKDLNLKARWKGFGRVIQWPGRNPQLFGQTWGGAAAPFSNSIQALTWQQGALQAQKALNLPASANLYNMQPIASDGGQPLIALLDINDHLQIFNNNGERLYQDDAIYGGHRSHFSVADPDDHRGSAVMAPVYLAPPLRLGPQGELLIPVNNGSRFMQNQRNYSSSYLLALKWENDAPIEVWRTRESKKYLADFYLGDFFNQQQPVLGQLHGGSSSILDFFGKKSSDMSLTLSPLTDGVLNSQQLQ